MLQIVLEIRKLVLFSKLNVLDFRKLFLNTFYKLYLIRRNVLNTNNVILNSRYSIWIRLIFFTVHLYWGLKSQLGKLGVHGSWVKKFSGQAMGRNIGTLWIADILTLDFSTPGFNPELSNLGLMTSWLKRLGLKSPDLKLGVKMYCNFFFYWPEAFIVLENFMLW